MEKELIGSRPLVCFFDSGIGGLNLMRACAEKLPFADFAYFADNYNVPYGKLGNETIVSLVDEKFSRMEKMHCAAAVIACNTATAVCAEYLRKKYAFQIIGIQPAVKQAAKEGGRIAVLATEATANSPSFLKLMARYGTADTKVYALADLAVQIEENIFDLDKLDVKALLPTFDADAVVLGCTHYIFLKEQIQKLYSCKVYDGLLGTADHLRSILGISDHFGLNDKFSQKITFLGGDFVKNSRVYCQILKNKKFI